ncbi:MAG: glycine cleavage system protein H [Acidimicrobiales bacterium mtb01]|nr:glycine cleavage system protein GcvH [Actinomycetota bacterium]TEX45177.1 MAG: glycine cleavage system protein H [Acidimicrobiales bacterium mtb01]
MGVQEGLLYASDHEWVKVTGRVARIGITDFAQDALGDVVYIEAPEIDRVVVAGESFSEVESTKSVSDIYAPVAGTVVAVNDELIADPSLINSEPYGRGWICDIRMDSDDVSHLLDAAAYSQLIGG